MRTMDETSTQASSAGAPKTRRKAPARRAGGSKARGRGKAARKGASRKGVSVEEVLRGFARKANQAGASLAAISGEGLDSARRALGTAGAASKSTIDRIAREWKQMDGRRRAQFIAALLAALAAASAPIVRSKMKKR
ncbi:MAG: hypothetical protein M3R34_00775 [Acidobacteriota bacterium]|nr:hypothetical protein [Acidobacteriota bacterium]